MQVTERRRRRSELREKAERAKEQEHRGEKSMWERGKRGNRKCETVTDGEKSNRWQGQMEWRF